MTEKSGEGVPALSAQGNQKSEGVPAFSAQGNYAEGHALLEWEERPNSSKLLMPLLP